MATSVRALGAFLHKFSNGVCLYSFKSIALHRTSLLDRSSLLPSSFSWISSEVMKPNHQVRRIWISFPLCMGRRSCKIAGRKGAQDAKKAKRYAKMGKEIVSAVKKGGPNPISNPVLAAVLEKARELDVPKDIQERNIKRATEKGQEAYIERFYEVYGFGGVSMAVEVLTDKINRSVALIREVVKDCGGKMADSGSVMFKFRRARVVNIKVTDAEKDQLLGIALDAGAEDVLDPPIDEDYPEEDSSGRYSGSTSSVRIIRPVPISLDSETLCRYYKIVSAAENYSDILTKLREEGIAFEPDNGFELLPINTVEVDDEAMELNKELMSKLLELDDVDAVYTDQK